MTDEDILELLDELMHPLQTAPTEAQVCDLVNEVAAEAECSGDHARAMVNRWLEQAFAHRAEVPRGQDGDALYTRPRW